ncbi:MAG: hypothetical protein ACXVID_01530 [Thermoanaerobaculia bacterium]
MARHPRLLRVAGGALVSLVLFLEGGCGSGRPISSSSSSSVVAAYERVRVNAWDPSRRFKALFKAEVSRNVGAISRGYLSVWWDGAGGTLTWRSSAPIVGTGRGGFLRRGGRGGTDSTLPVPGHFAPDDLIACIIGTPDAPASPSLPFEETPRGVRLRIDASKRTALLNREGMGIELTFPNGETVKLEPGEGVPRRIEANGPEGRAVLTLESYSSWPEGEPVPPA